MEADGSISYDSVSICAHVNDVGRCERDGLICAGEHWGENLYLLDVASARAPALGAAALSLAEEAVIGLLNGWLRGEQRTVQLFPVVPSERMQTAQNLIVQRFVIERACDLLLEGQRGGPHVVLGGVGEGRMREYLVKHDPLGGVDGEHPLQQVLDIARQPLWHREIAALHLAQQQMHVLVVKRQLSLCMRIAGVSDKSTHTATIERGRGSHLTVSFCSRKSPCMSSRGDTQGSRYIEHVSKSSG